MAISSLLFGILVWIAIVLVLFIFLYGIYAVSRETDLFALLKSGL